MYNVWLGTRFWGTGALPKQTVIRYLGTYLRTISPPFILRVKIQVGRQMLIFRRRWGGYSRLEGIFPVVDFSMLLLEFFV